VIPSPWTCTRLLKALNLNHRQIVEAALIRAEAIGRTEPHPEIAMKDQAERFPAVIASHGFNMRQTSSLALHLRSPFPRYSKATPKLSAGSQGTASGPYRRFQPFRTSNHFAPQSVSAAGAIASAWMRGADQAAADHLHPSCV